MHNSSRVTGRDVGAAGINRCEPSLRDAALRLGARPTAVKMTAVVLATAGYDHKIRFWEASSRVCTRTVRYPDSQVNCLAISDDKLFLRPGATARPRVRRGAHPASAPVASSATRATRRPAAFAGTGAGSSRREGRYVKNMGPPGAATLQDHVRLYDGKGDAVAATRLV